MCALSVTLCASKGRYYNKTSKASSEVLEQTIAQLNSKKNTIIKTHREAFRSLQHKRW